MNKKEFKGLLSKLNITFNEGITNLTGTDIYPRLDYWKIASEDQSASDDVYNEIDTYQVSFYSRTPEHNKYLELRKLLRTKGLRPQFLFEFEAEDRLWHTYFSIELVVDG